jgi:alkanesulfonate monooxygenase SsuD/methylene tetrahydromethanopterin reductase-like flavin-dependent oxidoreductase (luciferase family)
LCTQRDQGFEEEDHSSSSTLDKTRYHSTGIVQEFNFSIESLVTTPPLATKHGLVHFKRFIDWALFPRSILNSEKLGFALRPGVFSLQEIKKAAVSLEASDRVSRMFIPDHRTAYESLEIASSILALTKRIHAGSGVIRLLEHDPSLLARRVRTLQDLFSNRLVLGVGTGSPGAQPAKTVSAMLQRLDELKRVFQNFPTEIKPPEMYAAALRLRIAKRAARLVDGLLLNFCSPSHAARLISEVRAEKYSQIDFGCYLKIFYSSRSDEAAQRLMVQEFLNYDSTPQYHEMFVEDGTAKAISSFKSSEGWKSGPVEMPNELLRVSLANPRSGELAQKVKAFRQAGVTLPVIYPYFPNDEDSEFKIGTVRGIIRSI